VLNVILTTMFVFFGQESAVTSNDSIIHLRQVGSARLKVNLINTLDQPICTSRIRFINYNLELETGNYVERGRDAVSGRPAAGCLVIKPGASASYTYNLKSAFPALNLEGKQVCYTLLWDFLAEPARNDSMMFFRRSTRSCIVLDK
jgi:hypothetical protein